MLWTLLTGRKHDEAYKLTVKGDESWKILGLQLICILVVWPVVMGVTGFTTYVAVIYSVPINVASNFSYMSAIIVTCVNIAGSKLVTSTTEMEGWSGRTQIKAKPRRQDGVLHGFTAKLDILVGSSKPLNRSAPCLRHIHCGICSPRCCFRAAAGLAEVARIAACYS